MQIEPGSVKERRGSFNSSLTSFSVQPASDLAQTANGDAFTELFAGLVFLGATVLQNQRCRQQKICSPQQSGAGHCALSTSLEPAHRFKWPPFLEHYKLLKDLFKTQPREKHSWCLPA